MVAKKRDVQSNVNGQNAAYKVIEVLEETKEKVEDALLTFDLSEPWRQDNHYILSHYRPTSYSCRKSFASITRLHNETVNIFTHLVPGAILVLLIAALLLDRFLQLSILTQVWAYLDLERFQTASRGDAAMIAVFLVGACSMFTASWTYHTLANHSPLFSKKMNQVDYVGIICMILGSFFPSVYYGHYCDPNALRFWLLLLSSFGFATFCFTIMDRFRSPRWRPFRAGMFIALGLSAVIPVLGAVWTRGLDQVHREMSLTHVTLQGALYIVGAGLYAMRIPERYWPGKFDLFGSSHQIFHCCVVAAGIIHALGLWKAFEYRHGMLRGACPGE